MSSSPFSHYAFYNGTKKVTPLKIRNPSIHPSQIMPSPTGVPFNIADMPWCYTGKPGQVMEFNGSMIRPCSPETIGQYYSSVAGSPQLFPDVRKRKPEPDVIPIPSKQFLSEEAMASHLNNLHLSSEYTAHNLETTTAAGSSSPGCGHLDEDEMFAPAMAPPATEQHLLDDLSSSTTTTDRQHHVYMSPAELEDRLKKAQRISLCEEVRKLDKRGEILPQVLLERIEKPCTALVLWQPPQVLEKLLTKITNQQQNKDGKEKDSATTEAAKNTAADQQHTVGGDLMMSDCEEPLPDLPDYDDDLDFEENNNNVASVSDLNSMDVEM